MDATKIRVTVMYIAFAFSHDINLKHVHIAYRMQRMCAMVKFSQSSRIIIDACIFPLIICEFCVIDYCEVYIYTIRKMTYISNMWDNYDANFFF